MVISEAVELANSARKNRRCIFCLLLAFHEAFVLLGTSVVTLPGTQTGFFLDALSRLSNLGVTQLMFN